MDFSDAQNPWKQQQQYYLLSLPKRASAPTAQTRGEWNSKKGKKIRERQKEKKAESEWSCVRVLFHAIQHDAPYSLSIATVETQTKEETDMSLMLSMKSDSCSVADDDPSSFQFQQRNWYMYEYAWYMVHVYLYMFIYQVTKGKK